MFAVVALAAVFASCSKDDSTVDPGPASSKAADYFMPHRAGNSMTYIVTIVAKFDTMTVADTRDTSIFTAIAATRTSDGGKTLQGYFSSQGGRSDTGYAYLGDNEIMVYDSTLRDASANVWLKAPLAVGTTWKAVASDTATWTITSTSDIVVTPAGTFTRVIRTTSKQTDESGNTMTNEYYFASGVGLVKMTIATRADVGGSVYTSSMVMLIQSRNY
jgi:hypothetical protein